jgi:hypothetical protein
VAFRSSPLPVEAAWGSSVPDVSYSPTQNIPVPTPYPNIRGGMSAPRAQQMVIRHLVEQEPALLGQTDLDDRAGRSPDPSASIAELLEQASPRTIASLPPPLAQGVLPMIQSQAGNAAANGFLRLASPSVRPGGGLDARPDRVPDAQRDPRSRGNDGRAR